MTATAVMTSLSRKARPSQAWTVLPEPDVDNKFLALGLYRDKDSRAIICIKCKYALQTNGERVSRHLGEKHDIPPTARKGLSAFMKHLSLPDPNQIASRADHSPPHPHLAVCSGGACKHCNYRSTSLELVRRHLSKTHRCKSDQKHWLRDSVESDLQLQSWTINGARDFWVVQRSSTDVELDVHGSPRRRRQVAIMHEEEEQWLEEGRQKQSATDTGVDDLALTSNWMRRTGWATTFNGVDRQLLQALCQSLSWDDRRLELGRHGAEVFYSSAGDEKRLSMIGKAVDHFFERCENTAEHTSHSVRCWLRSHIPKRPYKAPFELPGRRSTSAKYRSLWKSLLYLAVRMYRLNDATCEALLRGQLSEKQRRAVALIWAATQDDTHGIARAYFSPLTLSLHEEHIGLEAGGDSDSGTPSSETCDSLSADRPEREKVSLSEYENTIAASSEYEDSELSDDNEVDISDAESSAADERGLVSLHVGKATSRRNTSVLLTAAEEILADAIGQMSLFLCQEPYVDGNASSTLLVYFSGILGFSASGLTFERPRNYTPKLSGLIYCMRLCMLEATLPRFEHLSNGWQVRPRTGDLSRLNRVRERYMCFGCQAPMGELLSLRSYGRAFSRSDGPSFRVNWSDDSETVSWNDGKIKMSQFRGLGTRVHDRVAAAMSRLMYGLHPDLDLKKIKDRMSNHESGYSFVQDPGNDLRSEYLKLSSRACLDPIDGLMSGERWNFDAVRRYLKEESSLLLHIFQLLFLRAGQCPRISELSSLECHNGPSTSRGIYVHDGHVLYITRHSKARQATNQEFQVARYLCPDDSILLAMYLIYVRPFADMLHRKCHGREQDRRLLFAAANQPHRPWGADVLTKALKSLTLDVCGAAFGVQVYRQVSIAVTERHIKSLSQPFNRYDDKSPHADIEVAFAWQSGHRPMQRGTSYGIDAAYPDSLQPALLRVYKWASTEWHRFLKLNHSLTSVACVQAPAPDGRNPSLLSKRARTQDHDGQTPKRMRASAEHQSASTTLYPQDRCRSHSSSSVHEVAGYNDPHFQHNIVQSRTQDVHGVLGGVVDDVHYQSVVDENSSSEPAFELRYRSVSTEMDDAGRDRRSHVSVQAYGFRGTFVDLGDLIRCQALDITYNGRVPTFVTCKDAVTALCRLPGTISARIRELGVPDQLMAADDCDNRDYVRALGRDLVEATSDVEVITLSVPDDLVAGGSDNAHQYEFWLWGLHEAVLHAFRRGQYLGLRFAHRKQFSATSDQMDVYQTHNVDHYIKPMLFGKSVCDRLRAAELQLIRSQRYPTPPSIIDDSDTLFAILHAIDYGAWLMAGYTIAFTQPHAWERGSVLLLQRNPQTVDTLSENCKTAASWWLERCASCIGNGFAGSDVLHAMETCRRGGRENRQWNLGKQIFQKGIKAQHGCVNCAFPGTACRRRQQQDECRAPPYCQFGEVIYDVVVGLCQSECYFYREHLSLAMQCNGRRMTIPRTKTLQSGSAAHYLVSNMSRAKSSQYSSCGHEPRVSNCASAARDVSNEDFARESVMEIRFPKTQSTIARPPDPAIRPRLQKVESRMGTDIRMSPCLFRKAYAWRRPRPTCLTETDVEKSYDSIEITSPYTLAVYHPRPSSISCEVESIVPHIACDKNNLTSQYITLCRVPGRVTRNQGC